MNSLKNLMIMVVLAAVGYGVYVSLARNNVDPAYPPGVAEQWQPGAPSPDMSGATQVTPGGPPPIGAASSQPGGSLAIGTGKGPASALSSPSQAPSYNPPGGAPDLTPITPYPLSANSAPSSNPMSTLGAPVSPEAVAGRPMASPSSPGAVRNLAPPPGAPAAAGDDGLLWSKFTAFMDEVRKKLDEGKLAEAHLALSTLYGHPDLPEEQARQIVGLLDRLAGTVIYSRQHYLEPAYFAKSGETIEQVARQYNVPWQLLARINGLMPPGASNNDEATKDQPLPEGMELKVIRGPFDAVVNLEEQELTLILQDRYAGRFPIGIGKDQSNIEGVYTVRDKILDPAYYGADGVSFAHDDPQNPLGEAWIGLTDRIGIHGAGDSRDVGRNDNQGSICVGRRDIQDLYGILSVGSRVKVMR
ncbi:MAG: L,D-transpeptidase family protein [Planctomycetes bacterium]|nr:L,D-transpeptidase family protein [Planctomycetota bacterium]MBU4399131.1 L,D-transpeptidase family protein [Planctomycetota bacterium]MCG2683049.1 L,D-transpeptidase family protein [Planctomycetales bacterium]